MITVIIPVISLFPLTYYVPLGLDLAVGDLVIVPFRHKEITGIVWEVSIESNNLKLKSVIDECKFKARITNTQIEFIKRSSSYYLAELGTIAKLVLPVDVNETPILTIDQEIPQNFNLSELSQEQNIALELINNSIKPVVIKGVTGSGKTEVYFHALANELQNGRQGLIMLPEIALSNQIIDRFIQKFGFKPAIWNSSITKAQKKRILRGIMNGQIRAVIGTRSSLFLPYANLGIVIIDEEHDQSYKQDTGILYNARDMAVLRAAIENSKVVLVSATPSIETIHNINLDKYQLVPLKNRYKDASMPTINIVDMRKENLPSNSWLSPTLIKAINANLVQQKQTLLFLNRKGYAPLMLCKSCGYRFECNLCSASMVVHKSSKKLQCHHCGNVSKIHQTCPDCKSSEINIYGPGIERIAEEAHKLFPNSRISIISRDSNKPDEIQSLLQRVEQGEIDILIGTQIITKGYHFPNLTLVGVIDADAGFIGGDFRASERMYQLLHQVGGRAGREEHKGSVFLQSYNPENKVLVAIKEEREEDFINAEIDNRKNAQVPPFHKMAAITLTGKDQVKVFDLAHDLVKKSPKTNVRILGPTEAMIFKVSGKYRYRILALANKEFNLQKYLHFWLSSIKPSASIHVKVDIDPYNFY